MTPARPDDAEPIFYRRTFGDGREDAWPMPINSPACTSVGALWARRLALGEYTRITLCLRNGQTVHVKPRRKAFTYERDHHFPVSPAPSEYDLVKAAVIGSTGHPSASWLQRTIPIPWLQAYGYLVQMEHEGLVRKQPGIGWEKVTPPPG